MSDLNSALAQLGRSRAELELLKKDYDQAYAQFLRQNFDLLEAIKDRKDMISSLEASIRAMALAEFKESGNNRPAWGVKINHVTECEYPEVEAVKWAREHGQAVRFDKTAFEKIAKADPESMPEWLKIVRVPKAMISMSL